MNASTRAIAANFFQCAEHEVEEKLTVLRQILGAGGASNQPAGPSQQDFDTLKSSVEALEKRVETAESTLHDLTTPDIADAPASDGTGNASGTVTQS